MAAAVHLDDQKRAACRCLRARPQTALLTHRRPIGKCGLCACRTCCLTEMVPVLFAAMRRSLRAGRRAQRHFFKFQKEAERRFAIETPPGRQAVIEGRPAVNTKTGRLVVLLFGFAVAGFVSDAGAQTERAKDRDAAIEKCIARAHREYPDPGESEAIFRARSASYKACMAENGQAP